MPRGMHFLSFEDWISQLCDLFCPNYIMRVLPTQLRSGLAPARWKLKDVENSALKRGFCRDWWTSSWKYETQYSHEGLNFGIDFAPGRMRRAQSVKRGQYTSSAVVDPLCLLSGSFFKAVPTGSLTEWNKSISITITCCNSKLYSDIKPKHRPSFYTSDRCQGNAWKDFIFEIFLISGLKFYEIPS